jgi:hypothetical protein
LSNFQAFRIGFETTFPRKEGVLGQSVREFAKNLSNNVIEVEIGVSFDSLNEAYDFYILYSWENTFGIRYRQQLPECLEDKMYAGDLFCKCSVSAVNFRVGW